MVKQNSNGTLLTLAVIVFVVSAVLLIVSTMNVFAQPGLSPDPEQGTATVEIQNSASIIFPIGGPPGCCDTVDWGIGKVNGGATETLKTDGTVPILSSGFNTVSDGFVVENDGNVDIQLLFYVDTEPPSPTPLDTWLPPGTGPSVVLRMNVDNCVSDSCGFQTVPDTDLTGACDVTTSGYALGVFVLVGQTQPNAIEFCNPFFKDPINNGVEVDLELDIPSTVLPTVTDQSINLIADVFPV